VPSGTGQTTASRSTRQRTASGPGAADLAAVAVGGGIGSVARYLLSQAFPAGHGFPWAIFAVNVSGCFLLGLLMVYLLDVWAVWAGTKAARAASTRPGRSRRAGGAP
jgi:CrcB protein